jgi:glutathione synthase/RimK-type ligase-like ATP-grasp enzyme
MPTIAFASDRDHEELVEGDRMLKTYLEDLGHSVTVEVWNDEEVQWSRYDLVLIRSTWNYSSAPDSYLDWISRLESADLRLWNPPEVVRWNLHKEYLKDLRESGISVPPSFFVPEEVEVPLDKIMDEKGWDAVVLKPLIGAGGTGVERFTLDDTEDGQRHLNSLVQDRGALVQEFLPEVTQEGEWSFIFAGNQFSHAVLKTPSDDEFRVQRALGGTRHHREPPERLRRQAEDIVKKITKPYLYLRLDGIARGGRLMVLELEMIEPRLYLEGSESGVEVIGEAIDQALEDGLSIDFFETAVPSEIATENGG